MLMQTNPAQGKQMLERRLAEAPQAPLVSYCQGCVDIFSKRGRKSACYLLELLYQPSRHAAWRNRIANIGRWSSRRDNSSIKG